nr:indolepyruvate ferredoxin oxidoreductase subunit alpha [Candidatus Freyarchaeota archaeon]
MGKETYAPPTFLKWASGDVAKDFPGKTFMISCNEAIARGAIEAGVKVVAAYPGSPLQYTIESLAMAAKIYPSMHVEWSSNEKVAYDVTLGAAMAGVRSLSPMKQLGMNVVLDSLVQGANLGPAGFVLAVGDDPGALETENEMDTRYLARYAEVPVLEPTSVQEVKDYTLKAFELSEKVKLPVVVRITTGLAYQRAPVVFGEIHHDIRERETSFEKNRRWILGDGFPWPMKPFGAKHMRFHDELPVKEWERTVGSLPKAKFTEQVIEGLPWNTLTFGKDSKVGVIAVGECYQDTMEAIKFLGMEDEVAVLKLITSYPLPKTKVAEILERTEKVLVVEQIEPFVETQVCAIAANMGKHAKILGKLSEDIPICNEITRNMIGKALGKMLGIAFLPEEEEKRIERGRDLLYRQLYFISPPRFCPGCPELAAGFALKTVCNELYGEDVTYIGDVGCYGMLAVPPLSASQANLSMGSGISIASGIYHAGSKDKIIAYIGDSTFFHSGLSALVNAVYNKANLLLYVLDNRTTGNTGHQPHPGAFGITATREPTKILDIEEIVKAFQVDYVRVVDPYDFEGTTKTLREALQVKGVAVVIARRTCALLAQRIMGLMAK